MVGGDFGVEICFYFSYFLKIYAKLQSSRALIKVCWPYHSQKKNVSFQIPSQRALNEENRPEPDIHQAF